MRIRDLAARKNMKYIFGAMALLVLVLGYPCRGFIRNTVLPLAASTMYTPRLSQTANDAAKELQDIYPFGQIKYISKDAASCQLSYARQLKTEIFCNKYLFRGQVSIKDVSVDSFEGKARTFENSLKAHGWALSIDYGGMNRVYDPPYHWWYLASYDKTTGKVRCDLTVQRDNNLHLLNAEIMCYRTVVFF